MFKPKSGAWGRSSVSLEETNDTWVPGDLLGVKANHGVYRANGSVYPIGFAEETRSATAALDETLASKKTTITKGIGLFITDRYTGTVAEGSLMVLDTSNHCMKVLGAETTPIIAVALGAGTGGTDQVEFCATGEMTK